MKRERNSVRETVEQIIRKVQLEGDRALEFYTKKWDGISLAARSFQVSLLRLKEAYGKIEPSVRAALLLAARRIRSFHQAELKRICRQWEITLSGMKVGQLARPVEAVGIYVPGGRTPYPSTVLMSAIPAKVAGVKRVAMVTPPKHLSDELLAAAWMAGVDAVFSVGGAQAVAALAFGTSTIPKVDKIVGPGNQYVNEAKRQLFGVVGIDTLAGPSEVAVWADAQSDAQKVLYNLLAQAEHDPNSKAFLLTMDEQLVAELRRKIPLKFAKQIELKLKKREEEIISEINAIAPEHLLLAIQNPKRVLKKIQNAGAIFLGLNSPVALGDYVAGPSHVLPTGKSATFGSGLSVKDFLKWSSVIENKSDGKDKNREAARTIAQAEKFYYHALSLSK